jgi:outer membrane immunogenic protein
MKRVVLCLLIGLPLACFAGDKEVLPVANVPPPPPACDFSWTGFYAGLHLGGAWTGNDPVRFPVASDGFEYAISPDSRNVDLKGVAGGGGLGFNYQFYTHWLIGAETDFDGADLKQRTSGLVMLPGAPGPVGAASYPLSTDTKVDWFGTVRGRVGFVPFCRLLLYGTGGFAYADYEFSSVADFSSTRGPLDTLSRSDVRTGWTAGGGAEIAMTKHLTFKLEYLYLDVGEFHGTASSSNGVTGFVPYSLDTKLHTVRAGLNWKF